MNRYYLHCWRPLDLLIIVINTINKIPLRSFHPFEFYTFYFMLQISAGLIFLDVNFIQTSTNEKSISYMWRCVSWPFGWGGICFLAFGSRRSRSVWDHFKKNNKTTNLFSSYNQKATISSSFVLVLMQSRLLFLSLLLLTSSFTSDHMLSFWTKLIQ